uniref:GPI inositol-deacylase n=1 Tax=Magallana gigas TaxID=29159 RepID=K1PQS1_MAGGI
MASDMYRIPSVQDVEKSVLELNNQVRLQSAFLSGQIDKIDGEGQWDGEDTVLDKNQAEKILVRTSSLKAELENFKLNLEKYQEAVKRSSSSGELKAAEHDEPSEAPLRDKAEKMADSDTIVTQPESSSEGVDFHLSSFNTDGGSLEKENNNVTPRNGTNAGGVLGVWSRKFLSAKPLKKNFQDMAFMYMEKARSLGSVSLRRAMDKRTHFFFNYFTVDFNEDLSALYGGVLQDETEFVHSCIKKILRLYKNAENKPSTVILVGHSMGGMIARALFTLPDFDHTLVNTIITQSTPHQIPVLSVDSYMASFYRNVNNYWREFGATNLSHVTVVSTGGGHRDYQVRNSLSSLKGTISMPKAWVSTDHLCAVWCKEVVMATVRAIFDIVDTSTNQVSTDANYRMNVFRHHFLSHSGSRSYTRSWTKELTLDPSATWVMEKGLTWEFARDQVNEQTYISIPIERQREDTFVAVSDIESKDWICVCKSETGDGRCKKCKNLSKYGEAIPPSDSWRKVVHVNLKKHKSMTHVIIMVPRTKEKVEVMGDIYRRDDRHLSYRMPGFIDMIMTYPESVTQGTGVLTLFNDTLFYDLHLLNMDQVLKAFTVKLEPKKCSAVTPDLHDGYMMKLHVPESNEDAFSFNKLSETGYLQVKLQSVNIDYSSNIRLQVYTDPSCTYQLKILVSPVQMLGQVGGGLDQRFVRTMKGFGWELHQPLMYLPT